MVRPAQRNFQPRNTPPRWYEKTPTERTLEADPMSVVLVPRRAGNPERERLWDFTREWWEARSGMRVVEGHHDDGPFNRSAAINRAAERAGAWSTAVIIDGDVVMDLALVEAAIGVARYTGAPALAYTERIHISPAGTGKILDGYIGDWRPFVHRTFYDSCSSAVVVTRDLFEAVCGFDERFIGWGAEDVGFRCAAEIISGKPLAKIEGTLWHLYHTTSGGNNRSEPTYIANIERMKRYTDARERKDIAAIRELLAEPLPTVPASDPDSAQVREEHAARVAARANRGRRVRT